MLNLVTLMIILPHLGFVVNVRFDQAKAHDKMMDKLSISIEIISMKKHHNWPQCEVDEDGK